MKLSESDGNKLRTTLTRVHINTHTHTHKVRSNAWRISIHGARNGVFQLIGVQDDKSESQDVF